MCRLFSSSSDPCRASSERAPCSVSFPRSAGTGFTSNGGALCAGFISTGGALCAGFISTGGALLVRVSHRLGALCWHGFHIDWGRSAGTGFTSTGGALCAGFTSTGILPIQFHHVRVSQTVVCYCQSLMSGFTMSHKLWSVTVNL